jgi:hypothetical protein
MYVGIVAPQFIVPDYASELQQCRRYFLSATYWVAAGAGYITTANFPVEMRATPTRTGGGTGYAVDLLNTQQIAHHQTTQGAQAFTFNARL